MGSNPIRTASGRLPEWTNGTVLKTVRCNSLKGSNPLSSSTRGTSIKVMQRTFNPWNRDRSPGALPFPIRLTARLLVLVQAIEVRILGGERKQRRTMFISKAKLEKIKTQAWNDGFDTGRKKAVNETRKVFLKLLTKEAALGIIDNTEGLNRAIEILRKGKQ